MIGINLNQSKIALAQKNSTVNQISPQLKSLNKDTVSFSGNTKITVSTEVLSFLEDIIKHVDANGVQYLSDARKALLSRTASAPADIYCNVQGVSLKDVPKIKKLHEMIQADPLVLEGTLSTFEETDRLLGKTYGRDGKLYDKGTIPDVISHAHPWTKWLGNTG